MSRIVHFHYNVPGNTNIGDEAHVLAIQDSLRAQMLGVQIIDRPISFLCKYQLPASVPGSHSMPLGIHNAARRLRGQSYAALLAEVNSADMVVIGGGGVYMDHLLPFNVPLIDSISVPIVVVGAGLNRNTGSAPFSAEQVESIVALGTRAKLQSVRDYNTLEFLRQYGVRSEMTGDPAMFLKTDPVKKAGGGLRIGLNIAAHGWKQQTQYEDAIVIAYADMAKKLATEQGAVFKYFIHHPGELRAIELLRRQGVKFEEIISGDARTVKAAYAGVDLAVSMMLHSTIFAFGEGVPVVCVGYDDKNRAFMELTGQLGQFVPVSEINERRLDVVVHNLAASRDTVRVRLNERYTALAQAYDAFIKKM